MDTTIESISALEILDSRGNPTVEVEAILGWWQV
jgi:enolase